MDPKHAPLDWLAQDIFGEPWTRAGHQFDKFCNATLAALLLGMHRCTDTLNFDILEEAINRSVRLFGATKFDKTLDSYWFTKNKTRPLTWEFPHAILPFEILMSSVNEFVGPFKFIVAGVVTTGFAYNGKKYGTIKVSDQTKTKRNSGYNDTFSVSVYPESYTGFMKLVLDSSAPYYVSGIAHGKGEFTYKDGSIYDGQFSEGYIVMPTSP